MLRRGLDTSLVMLLGFQKASALRKLLNHSLYFDLRNSNQKFSSIKIFLQKDSLNYKYKNKIHQCKLFQRRFTVGFPAIR